jgi:hypothetical protein
MWYKTGVQYSGIGGITQERTGKVGWNGRGIVGKKQDGIGMAGQDGAD